ncbi:MAG: glycerate 2-kinase [Gaiellales bacterium]|nr:glycerate 2-kinase [Gaiellales bacterium]
MLVVCAPDKLRGALDAEAAAAALARGARRSGAETRELPLADGGEGTLDALVASGHARAESLTVRDPLGRPVRARLGRLEDGTFLVEAAEAVGHARLRPGEQDPRRATSAGVGDLLRGALDRGARRVLVALGGTVNVDGGVGLLDALGALPEAQHGRSLLDDPEPDRGGLDPRLAGVDLVALYDVDVPLAGPDGAAWLFGPQKGLRGDDLATFDAALARLGARLGGDQAMRPGAGAAGGLGAALYWLGASGVAGAEAVASLVGLEQALADATLCLTAEGAVDRQSGRGKTVAAVAHVCARAGVACVVLGGRVDPEGATLLEALGARVLALGPVDRPLEQALAATTADLERIAEELSA